jgi:NAD(P)-dependent dehydrogenase (short-subunit alcohol dehydrogenase family)
MTLQGKVVLVTGASRGLGRAVAEESLRAGAFVLAIGRDPLAMSEARAIFATHSQDFEMITLDLRDEAAVSALIASRERLDVVVNNAGIARALPFLETPTQELRDVLEINLVAAFVVMREAARKMLALGGGQIINIASDAALHGISRMAPYVASKHALLGMGRSVSRELRQKGVRVTTFCPGPIATDIFGPGTANPKALPVAALARTIVHLAELPPDVEVQDLLVEPTQLSL